jgi:hypothetical protein
MMMMMMMTEMVELSVSFIHLTWLIAQEDFIESNNTQKTCERHQNYELLHASLYSTRL